MGRMRVKVIILLLAGGAVAHFLYLFATSPTGVILPGEILVQVHATPTPMPTKPLPSPQETPGNKSSKEDELRRQLEEYGDPCKVMGVRIESVCMGLRRAVEGYYASPFSIRPELRLLNPLLDVYLSSGREEFLQDPTHRLLSDYLAWLKGEERRRGQVNLDPYDGDNMKHFIRTFY